ncbi:MAG TPA: hypothetical protein VLB84_11305, partial [Bacteroidia bacterium]|nr:hypothetical protein [Bacteroidia bacterium]
MWKKILFGITIVLCIVAGVYWFTYMKEIKTPVSSGINAIPLDAAFIFESKQSLTTWNKLSASDMWHELIGTNAGTKLNLQIGFMDSLLKSSPAFSQLLFNQSLFISAHTSGINSFNFLFVYSLPNLSYHSTLTDFIKTVDNKPIFVRTYDEAELYSIQDKNKNVFYYSFLRGTLMMSTSQLLVEDAIRQLKSGLSFSMDRNFKNVIYTAGKNVDGNLYLNYKKLPKLLNHFIISTLQEETADLSS